MTLVEMLIVIALLAAIGAIVLPYVAAGLNERAFETAADTTSEQLVLARAHAQATGEPVEVRYHASTAQVEARMFSPWLPGFEFMQPWKSASPVGAASTTTSNAAFDESATRCVDPGGSARNDGAIAESWANRSLSHGIRLANRPPAKAVQSDDQRAARSEDHGSNPTNLTASSDERDDIRLAVFMPDGSALMGAPIWFNDDDGRIGKLTINPWTGVPIFERVNDLEPVVAEVTDAAEDSSTSGKGLDPSSRKAGANDRTTAKPPNEKPGTR